MDTKTKEISDYKSILKKKIEELIGVLPKNEWAGRCAGKLNVSVKSIYAYRNNTRGKTISSEVKLFQALTEVVADYKKELENLINS